MRSSIGNPPFFWLFLASFATIGSSATADETTPGARLFGTSQVVQLAWTLTAEQFAALDPPSGGPGGRGFGPPGFGGPPRPPVEGTHRNTFGVDFPWSRGTLRWGDQTWDDVGLRYKGNYTYMATARSLKKSLKVDLDKYHDDQTIDGLSGFYLHCGVSDPTRARESLSYAFFRAAQVPAPRTAIAEVSLTVPGKYDREIVGVYALVESVNKAFLKQHFGDGSGMLLKPEGLQGGPTYLGADWKEYADRYRPRDTPTEPQQQQLIAFTRLISEANDETFARSIGNFLDVDAFLRFIAANALLANLDSYLGFGHNYYLYLVPDSNRFVFIPWDLDLSLATWPAAGTPEQLVELSLLHPHAGTNKLLDRMLASSVFRERYLGIIKELTATVFTKEKLTEQLNPLEAALREPLAREAKAIEARKEGGGGGPGGFGMGFGGGGQFGQSMPPRRFIELRTKSVAAQLAGEAKGFEPRPFGPGFGGPGVGRGPGGGPGGGPGRGAGAGRGPGGFGGGFGPGGPKGPETKPKSP